MFRPEKIHINGIILTPTGTIQMVVQCICYSVFYCARTATKACNIDGSAQQLSSVNPQYTLTSLLDQTWLGVRCHPEWEFRSLSFSHSWTIQGPESTC